MFESPSNLRWILDSNSSQDRHFTSQDNLRSFLSSPSVRNGMSNGPKSITCKKVQNSVKLSEHSQSSTSFYPQAIRVEKLAKKSFNLDEPPAATKKPRKSLKKDGISITIQPIENTFNKLVPSSVKNVKSPANRQSQPALRPAIQVQSEQRATNLLSTQNRQIRTAKSNADFKKNLSMTMTFGVSSPNMQSKPHMNVKREESREKKPRGTAKPNININVDELVKNNAQKMLEEIRKEREKEEIHKRIELEKQQRFKLNSRRIRINNLKNFGIPNQQKQQKNLPWGADQRRLLTSPKSSSQERPSREKSQIMRKMTENERRSNLGLDKFNADILEKIIQRQKEGHQVHDHEPRGDQGWKAERASSPNTQPIREQDIKNFIQNKRKKFAAEKTLNRLVKKDTERRIQENLEKLNHELKRLSHSKSPKSGKQHKKKRLISSADYRARKSTNKAQLQSGKLAHRFGQRDGRESSSGSFERDQEMSPSPQQSFNLDEVEDDNYSFLYNEFKQILNSKHRNHASYQDQNASSTSVSGEHTHTHSHLANATDKREILQKRYENLASNFENIKQATDKHHTADVKAKKAQNISASSGNLNKKGLKPNIYESEDYNQNGVVPEIEGYYVTQVANRNPKRDLKVNEILGAMSYKRSPEGKGSEENAQRMRDQEKVEQERHDTEEYTEIMEAAAIFIQKNFRGYLTRKLLRDYFEKLCGDNQSDSQMEYARKHERYEESELRLDNFTEENSLNQKDANQSKPSYNHRVQEQIYEAEDQESFEHRNAEERDSQFYEADSDVPDANIHGNLIQEILVQARSQQEKEEHYDQNIAESPMKIHYYPTNYGAETGKAGKTSNGVQNVRYEQSLDPRYEDSDPDCDIDPQTLSLLDLIERQKDQMQAAKKRFQEQEEEVEAEKELLKRYAKRPQDDNKESRKSAINEISGLSFKVGKEDQNTLLKESDSFDRYPQGINKTSKLGRNKDQRNQKDDLYEKKAASDNMSLVGTEGSRKQNLSEQHREALQQVGFNNTKEHQHAQNIKHLENFTEAPGRDSATLKQGSGYSNLIVFSDENRGSAQRVVKDAGKKAHLQPYSGIQGNFKEHLPFVAFQQGTDEHGMAGLNPVSEGRSNTSEPAHPLSEKNIIISALESETSHDGIPPEQHSSQVKHFNSLDHQFSSTSNITHEISPIRKFAENSPTQTGSSEQIKRKYKEKISQIQKQSIPSYNIENEEYSSSSISKRAKAKSNPESIQDTKRAIEKLFGSLSRNHDDQNFEFENQHRRQKSESDYMRETLIEELRKLEQFSPTEPSFQNNKFGGIFLSQKDKEASPGKPKTEVKKADYVKQEPPRFEESTDKMEEGMRQWLEGNLNNLESDHDEEESKQLESEKPSQQSVSTKEILAPKTTPNEKGSNSQGAKVEVDKLKDDQVVRWDEIVNQITLLRQTEGESMTHTALNMIELLQQKLEANKKILEKTISSEPQSESTHKGGSSIRQPPNTEVISSAMFIISPRENSRKNNPISPQMKPKNLLEKFDSLNTDDLKSTSYRGKSSTESKGKKLSELPWKKGNLVIDTEMIESETSPAHFKNGSTTSLTEEKSAQGFLLDLRQMRRTLGSEQLVKERLNSPGLHESLTDGNEGDVESPSTEEKGTTSIFDQDPFKLFTERRLKEFMRQDNMQKVIKMRERVLDFRHKSQIDKLNQELQNNGVSPRTFQSRRSEIEKWITQEKEQIQLSKHALEKGLSYFNDTLKRTQRDILFMQRMSSPKEEKRINVADFNVQGSFSDDDAHNKTTAGTRKEGILMPDLDSEVLIYSGRDKFPRRKTLSPNGSKNIKIVDDLDLEEYSSRGKPNKKTDTSSDTLFSPRRDNLEDTIKERAENSERSKESPRVVSPKANPQIFTQAAKHTLKRDNNTLERIIHVGDEPKKGLVEKAPNNSQEDLDPTEPREDYEMQYENFLKVLADFNNSKPIKEGLNDDLGSPHPKGYLSSLRKDVISRDANAPAVGESLFDVKFIREVPEEPISKDESRAKKLGDSEIHNIISRTVDWCIQQIEREQSSKHELVRPENPGIDLDLIEKHSREAIQVHNYMNLDYDDPLQSSPIPHHNTIKQENVLKMEKVTSLEPSPIQNEIGIPTSIAAVKDYLDFLGELIKAHFRQDFLTNINIPTSLSPEEKLAALHGYDISLLEGQASIAQLQDAQAVLSIKIYLTAEEKIRELLPDRTDFISDLEIIHNKSLFDCLNEALDYFRPFSIYGAPYPWRPSPAAIPRKISDSDIDIVLDKSKEKVLLWASFRAGYIGNGALMETDSAEKKEEVLTQIKEERLSKVYEREEEWINYDDQRTELEIEIADVLFERLTLETAELLYNLSQNKKPKPTA